LAINIAPLDFFAGNVAQ